MRPGPSTLHGQGVFAAEKIRKGQLIAVDGGRIVDVEDYKPIRERYDVMVGEGKILIPADPRNPGPLWLMNHGCFPNVKRIGGLLYLAKRDVAEGEELTIDYAPLMADHPYWRIRCSCDRSFCRKEITSKDWQKPMIAARLWEEWLPHVQQLIVDQGVLKGL